LRGAPQCSRRCGTRDVSTNPCALPRCTQGCLVWGSGSLEVTAGCLDAYGFQATPETHPVQFGVDARTGGALLLQPAPGRAQVPRIAQATATTVVVHSSTLGHPHHQQQQHRGDGGRPSSSFGACAPGEPGAPAFHALPPEWRQAAAAVADASQQRPARGVGPAVVAVCGPKGSGKSSFCRALVNALLSCGHGAVVYLDTDCGQPEFTPPVSRRLGQLCRI
jgi:hypothetical protein